MSLIINTNYQSLYAQEYLTQNSNNLATAQNQLSSGNRIVNAGIDPAGLAISQTMNEVMTGLRQGASNANTAVSMVQLAQGGMQQSLALLQQMRQLSVEAAAGTYNSTQLADVQAQFSALSTQVGNISNTTQFNGISLLNNSTGSISVQVGEGVTTSDSITVTLTKASVSALSLGSTNVSSASGATAAMTSLDSAITTITTGLAKLGAAQTNLQSASAQDNNMADNTNNAQSTIASTDYAATSSTLAQLNILNQANIAMLSQANSMPQVALKLLQQ